MRMKNERTPFYKNILFYVTVFAALIVLISTVVILRRPDADYFYSASGMSYNADGREYITEHIESLPKGIYTVTIKYNSNADAHTDVQYDAKRHNTVYSDNPTLYSYNTSTDFDIWINNECSDFRIRVFYDENTEFSIDSIEIKTASNSKLYEFTKLFLLILLLVGASLLWNKRQKISEHALEVMVLCVVIFTASLGLFPRYLILGHDINFHLLRIDGLKEAFRLGDFPSKIQTNWCSGWGYAVSAMYGDITLILPALMRLCGFTVITSYKTFIFAVNAMTTIIAYLCFFKMSGKRNHTLIATAMYVLAPYRLCCIYFRAAVGEFTAMSFLPMIALGFYYAYCEDTEDEDYGKKLLVPVLGFALTVQTHLLTCVMLSIFIVLLCVICFKKTFRKKTFIYLCKIAGLSAVLSIGFLVPFLRFMAEPFNVKLDDNYASAMQYYGLTLTEIFAQKPAGTAYYNWEYLTSLNSRMSMPVGNAFFFVFFVYLYLLISKKISLKNKRVKTGLFLALMGVIATFMASEYFPYSFLHDKIKILCDYIINVRVPYRYITLAILFFSVFTLFALKDIKKKMKGTAYKIIFSIAILIMADQSISYLYNAIYVGAFSVYYDDVVLDSNDLIGYEYLYEGSSRDLPKYDHEVKGDSVAYSGITRNKNRFNLNVDSTGENGGNIEFPIYYYPGYVAKDTDGNKLTVERGSDNRLRVLIPSGYSGTLSVRYEEPIGWRICEVVSVIALVLLIYYEYCMRKGISFIKNRRAEGEYGEE